eukprot:TRINITY_DN2027_c0_g1_i2.p1 TRINITY_DN2027_c0_g1~~TRINITY_DN2027_c0_g1_i2.p1  ORF type:complete len:290 (-),score=60.66 TRINITY_DN2027_c0_g1_i2:111-980(-)
MKNFSTLFVVCLCFTASLIANVESQGNSMPCPFTRVLSVQKPALNGDDVYIMQNLVKRSVPEIPTNFVYDSETEACVSKLQSIFGLNPTGVFDQNTASKLLANNLADGYKDNGTIPEGYLYKVHVPVYSNRSIETQATLYWNDGTILHQFTVRTEGQLDNATGVPLNELCNSGSTPTGLMTFDLNSPESDPIEYGPYPINRAVQGLEGNAFIVISNIRDGILLHTGEWPNWTPKDPMPNSHGCIHGFPLDIKYVWQALVENGVVVRNNTFGQLPYPYKPQGILSIELLD